MPRYIIIFSDGACEDYTFFNKRQDITGLINRLELEHLTYFIYEIAKEVNLSDIK